MVLFSSRAVRLMAADYRGKVSGVVTNSGQAVKAWR